jgi:putative spermidine/putrescine transport system substrate-binding protein
MKSLRIAFVSALGLAAIGGGPGAAGEFDGVTLKVGTFGGPWREIQEQLLAPRLAAKGAKVVFVAGSPQDNLAKLIAARGAEPPMDVIDFMDATLPDMEKGGFLEKLDLQRIPNVKHLAKGQYDQTKVGNWTTQEGICYNEQKFKELGIPPPERYQDLAHPKLAGYIQVPDIGSGGGLSAIAGMAYAAGGDMQNIKPGLELIKSLKALKFWKQGTEVITQLKSGDIYAAVAHTGWCVRAFNAGLPVASTHPTIDAKTKGVLKQGWMGVVRGSRNAKAAMAYIDEFIEAGFQAEFAVKRGVVPENLLAIETLGKDPTLKKLMLLDAAAIARMLRPDFGKVDMSAWTDQWNRTVTR